MIVENLQEAECKELEITMRLTAYRAGSYKRPRVRFYLPKHDLEKQTQTKLKSGKMYQIKGRVEGICKFRIDCIEPKTRGFDIYVPKQHQEKVKLAEAYNIIISSVEVKELTQASREMLGSLERGHNWTRTFDWIFRRANEQLRTGHELIEDPQLESQVPRMVRPDANKFIVLKALATPQERNPHFMLSKRLLEDMWRIRFKEGKKYEIKWRVGESDEFTRSYVGTNSRYFTLGVPNGYPNRIQAGEEYRICIFSVNEKPRFQVAQSRFEPLVRIPKTALELTGFNQGDEQESNRFVVETQIQNLSASERPIRRCFSTYERSGKRIVLPLGSWEARSGDVIQPLSSKLYAVDDFVRDFNLNKSREFGNVRLNLDVNQIAMEVDGKKITLDQLRLDARGLRAVLTGRVEGTNRRLKFWFDGENVSLTFVRNWKVSRIGASEYGLEISYFQRANEECKFRQNFGEFDRNKIVHGIVLFSSPQDMNEPYQCKVSKSFQDYVQFRLRGAGNIHGYRHEKGHISEQIQRYLLSLTNLWEEVTEHPFPGSKSGSKKAGPDSLQRSKISNELYYFEFKWWKRMGMVSSSGRLQTARYCKEHPIYDGEKIKGAYVGVLDWDPRSEDLSFYAKKAWPERD